MQLLADGARQRMQPRSRSAGEDDALHAADAIAKTRAVSMQSAISCFVLVAKASIIVQAQTFPVVAPACTASHQSRCSRYQRDGRRAARPRTCAAASSRAHGESSSRRWRTVDRGPADRPRTSSARGSSAPLERADSMPPGRAVERVADAVDDLQVGPLVAAADIVLLADAALSRAPSRSPAQ